MRNSGHENQTEQMKTFKDYSPITLSIFFVLFRKIPKKVVFDNEYMVCRTFKKINWHILINFSALENESFMSSLKAMKKIQKKN